MVKTKTNDLFNKIFDLKAGFYKNNKDVKKLQKKVYDEVFDANKLAFILNNLSEVKKLYRPEARDSTCLESFYKNSKISKDGKIGIKSTKYINNENELMGRLQAKPALSGQGMVREVRCSIFNENYNDLDINNAHPVITKWICDNIGQECKYINEYIEKRDSIFEELISLNPGYTRGKFKQIFLAIMYGGDVDFKALPVKNDFIENYKNEISSIHAKFAETFFQFKKIVEDAAILHDAAIKEGDTTTKKRNYNILGKTASHICCFVENQLLQYMVSYLKDNMPADKFNNCIMCFDGIMFRADVLDNNKVIQDLEKIYSDMDIPIKLSIKEMKPLDLESMGYDASIKYDLSKKDKKEAEPIIIVSDKDKLLFDYNDDYYLFDFIVDLIGENNDKVWDSFSKLIYFMKSNVNRVYIRLLNHDNALFCKIDGDNPLSINKLSNFNIFFIIDSKTGETDDKTFSEIMETLIYNDIKFYNNLFCIPYDIYSDVKIDFGRTNKNNFNTWSGFQAKLLNKEDIDISKIQFILDHWKVVLANGNEEHYKYQLTYFHNLFKYPNKKLKVFMIFKSLEQQIGKGSIFIEFIMKYVMGLGISYKTDKIDNLTKRFNAHLMNKVLFIADEIDTVNDKTHSTFNEIKGLITESIMEIEIKGGKAFNFNNTLNGIGLTNKSWSVPLETGDARYPVFDCNPVYKNNTAHFDKLHSMFTQENANIFFSYLYYFETDVNIKIIPKTEIRENLINQNLNSSLRFINEVKDYMLNNYLSVDDELNSLKFNEDKEKDGDEFENEEWHDLLTSNLNKDKKDKDKYKIFAAKLFDVYVIWCNSKKEKLVNNTQFGINIKNDVEKKVITAGTQYVFATKKDNV